MQFRKILSVFEYTSWLFKQCSEQQNQRNDIYRIIEVKNPSSSQCKIVVQIIGKSMLTEYTPQEIVADDRLLEGFSKKDIRAITYFACGQLKKPKYKIVVQEVCEKFNKILFKLKAQHNDEVIVKTAAQISLDKNLINGLSQEDIQNISYVAGYENSQNEKNEMEIANKIRGKV